MPARAEKEITTAGTGNPTLTTGDAPDSICPYGWRLPDVNGDKTYGNLISIYRINRDEVLRTTPLELLMGGVFGTNAPSLSVSHAYYGTKRANSSSSTQETLVATSGYYINSSYSINSGTGVALRCLAR